MRKSLWATLAVAVLLGVGTLSSAQDSAAGGKAPVVVVSLSGYDALRGDLGTIGTIVGMDLVKQLDQKLEEAKVAKDKAIPGLDTTRPWGAAVFVSPEGKPSGFGFIPVTDLKQLMGVVKNPLSGEPFSADAEGVYEVNLMLVPPMFIGQKGKWAILANSRDLLKSAPEDPSALLGDLSKKYAVALKASVKDIPDALRKKAIEEMQSGAAPAMQQRPGEDEDQYKIRVNTTKQMLAKFTELINDLDAVQVGWAVDASNNATYLDIQVTAKPGTKTAGDLASLKEAKTNFAGVLLPEAAITMNMAGTMSDADVAQATTMLDQVRKASAKELENNQDLTKEQRDLATRLISDVLDVLQQTIAGKKSDAGMAVVLEPGAPTMVVATSMAGGEKLEKVLKDLVAEAKKEQPEIAKMITLDKEGHEGVKFHVATVPVADPEAAEVLGKTVDIVLGIGPDSLYVAAGKKALETVKKVIDKSKAEPGKSISPLQISVAGTAIAKFAAAVIPMDDAKQQAEKIAALLAQSGGKDHVTLVATGIPNGMNMRLTVEEGILKAAPAMGVGGPEAKAKRKAAIQKE